MLQQLPHVLLALLALTTLISAAVVNPVATSSKSVKREIGDARISGPYSSYPIVTETLGTEALTNLNYPGSLGNVYARDDEFYGVPDYYEYPQYAAGYGNYRTYDYYNNFDGPLLSLSGFPYGLRGDIGIGPLSAYPYYARSGPLGRSSGFYGSRLSGGYYD